MIWGLQWFVLWLGLQLSCSSGSPGSPLGWGFSFPLSALRRSPVAGSAWRLLFFIPLSCCLLSCEFPALVLVFGRVCSFYFDSVPSRHHIDTASYLPSYPHHQIGSTLLCFYGSSFSESKINWFFKICWSFCAHPGLSSQFHLISVFSRLSLGFKAIFWIVLNVFNLFQWWTFDARKLCASRGVSFSYFLCCCVEIHISSGMDISAAVPWEVACCAILTLFPASNCCVASWNIFDCDQWVLAQRTILETARLPVSVWGRQMYVV